MKNYVEVTHDYIVKEAPGKDGSIWVDESHTVWYAVRPTPEVWDYYKEEDGPSKELFSSDHGAWLIQGTTLAVYSEDDIAGLRKLLDAIEIELNEKNGEQ